MTQRQIAGLAVKLIGIFFLTQWTISSIFMVIESGYFTPVRMIPMLLLAAVSLLLIFAGDSIGGFLARSGDDRTIQSSLSLHDWQALFFSLIGISTVVRGLGSMTGAIVNYQTQHAHSPLVFLPAILQMVLGAALFFQARGLSNLWKAFQESRPMAHVDNT